MLISRLRATVRAFKLLYYLVAHIVKVTFHALVKGPNLDYAVRSNKSTTQKVFKAVGIHVETHGEPPAGSYVFVGNHRTYVDPMVAMLDVRALPVGKAEVASWPIIGYCARVSGIMFVKRESKSSRAAVLEAMLDMLKLGYSVVVYPEGTTHLLTHTMEFRKGAFNLAAKNGFGVVPFALDYGDEGDAWVGDDTFVPHFMRCFGKKHTYIKVRYGQAIQSDNADFLLAESQKWIDENMAIIRQEFESQKTSHQVPSLAN